MASAATMAELFEKLGAYVLHSKVPHPDGSGLRDFSHRLPRMAVLPTLAHILERRRLIGTVCSSPASSIDRMAAAPLLPPPPPPPLLLSVRLATSFELFPFHLCHAAHPLAEVRRRALRSLLFKQEHGLLAAPDTDAALPHVVAAMDLSCTAAAAGDPADALAVMQLFGSLMGSERDGNGADHALQCVADQALIRLADAAPTCTAAATALLGKLLCARGEAGYACSALVPCLASRPGPGSDTAASASPAASRPALQGGRLQPAVASTSNLVHSPPVALWSSPQSAAFSASPVARASPADAWTGSGTSGCGGLESMPRSAAAEALSEEDQQQLFEVALELGAGPGSAVADEAALLATLATLRHGVLADMPAAAVAGEPALVTSLLRLLEGGGQRPRVAAAALGTLQALAARLGASQATGHAAAPASPEAGRHPDDSRDANSAAVLAHAALLRCAKLCGNASLRHVALPAAAALVPLLSVLAGGFGAARKLLAPLLDTLADALHLTLVSLPQTTSCFVDGYAEPDEYDLPCFSNKMQLSPFAGCRVHLCRRAATQRLGCRLPRPGAWTWELRHSQAAGRGAGARAGSYDSSGGLRCQTVDCGAGYCFRRNESMPLPVISHRAASAKLPEVSMRSHQPAGAAADSVRHLGRAGLLSSGRCCSARPARFCTAPPCRRAPCSCSTAGDSCRPAATAGRSASCGAAACSCAQRSSGSCLLP